MEESRRNSIQPQRNTRSIVECIWHNKQLVVFVVLSLIFTLLYSREFLFSTSATMMGVKTTDAYQSLSIVVNNLGIINQGHLPAGTFWLYNFYGGSVATFYNVSNFPNIPHTTFLVLNFFLNDPIFWLKIFVFGTLIISQVCAFKLAAYYFKNTAIAWIFSIGYSFSTFYCSHIDNGHVGFTLAAALMPAVFLYFEKMFASPTRKNMMQASLLLIALFLGDLQVTIFAIYYILLRIVYQLVTKPYGVKGTTLLKRVLECAVLFGLIAIPFLLSFALLQNTDGLSVTEIADKYDAPSSLFFVRCLGSAPDDSVLQVTSLYVGIFLFATALVPTLLRRTFAKIQSKVNQQNYVFHLLVLTIFFLIAIGTPLSSLVTELFVRVPSRTQIVVILSICMCAGYGLICLADLLRNKSHKIQALNKNKAARTLIAIAIAAIVFVDLTAGATPVTSPLPNLTGADNYIQNQQGDFRILKYPMVWGYTNYESAIINHEIVGQSVIALRSFPPASELFTKLSYTFDPLDSNYHDPSNFTLMATVCGIKYIAIEDTGPSSPAYRAYFDNCSSHFEPVYEDEKSVVYENLYFKGTVFALKDTSTTPVLNNLTLSEFSSMIVENSNLRYIQDFNKITIAGNFSEPTYIVLSQAYSPFWVQANDGTTAFTKFLNVTAYQANRGTFEVEAVFSATAQTSNLYVVFAVALVLCCLTLAASSSGRKSLLRFKLGLSTAFGAIVMLLALTATSYAPQSLRMLGVFSGVFNNALLLFGVGIVVVSVACLIRSKFLLASKRTLATSNLFLRDSKRWVKAQKIMFSVILITSLALIIFAFYTQTTQTDILSPQLQTIADKQTETYVSVGTQFSLSGSGTALLTAALIMFAGLGLAVGYQLYSKIKSGTLTTKAVEFIGFIGLSAAVVFVFGNGGLMASADLINNQLVGLFAVVFSLVIMEFSLILYRPVVLSTVSAAQKKLVAVGEISGLLLKTLLAVSFFFILLVNVTSAVPEGLTWLDNNMAYIMVSILVLYVLSQGIYSGGYKTGLSAAPLDIIKPDSGVKRLHLGIFGGIIGVFLAGVLMRVLTLQTQNVVVSALAICAALGGLGFGALTNGSKKLRGIIGCIFGTIAIIFGLVMTYTAPIIVGYSLNGAPLYKWHSASFGEFIGNQLLSLHGVFYLLLGLMLAYLAATYLSYRVKVKRK